jgi:hypothetical protein
VSKWATHDAKRNWRTNLAFLIAGKELYDWRSRHSRLVAKMAEGATEARIIKLLKSHSHETEQESRDCDLCERYYGVGLALALIKGEQDA